MSFVKYRVKEVATDFGVTPKEITEIIGKYLEKPKSNTQVLTDPELNVVFEYITQKNQIKSLEQVFAVPAKAEPAKAEAPKAEEPKAEAKPAPRNEAPRQNAPRNDAPRQQQNRPQQSNPQPRQEPKAEAKPQEPERKRERRVVDTSAVQVNSNRFADVDNLVDQRVQDYQGGKQKIGGKKGQQQQQKKDAKFKGNKAKNEEQVPLR